MTAMSLNEETLGADGPHETSWWFVGIVCGATAALCLWVALAMPSLGVKGQWVWPYTKDALWEHAWVAGVYFALLAGTLWATLAKKDVTSREAGIVLAMLVAFAFGLQLAVAQLGTVGFYEGGIVTLAPWSGGYHSEALKAHDLRQYLIAYPETIRAMSVTGHLAHVSNHPPGYVVFYWLLDRATEASPVLTDAALRVAKALGPVEADVVGELHISLSRSQEAGMWLSCLALRLIVCLTMVPVYLLARRVTQSTRAGLVAAAFAALVPAFHLFSPYPDAIIIFLAPWVIYFWDKALEKRPILFGLLAGAAFFAATFFSLAVLVLGPIGLAMAAARWLQPQGRGQLVKNVVTAVAASVGAYLALTFLLWLATGCNLPRIFLVCFEKHSEFYAYVHRTYWGWLVWNLGDLALFLGLPVTMIAIGGIAAGGWSCRKSGLPHFLFQDRVLLSTAITVIVLDVLGLNRGEAGRLWMVFMPFFCIGVARVACNPCRNSEGRTAKAVWLLAAQCVQVCVFRLSLDVFGLFTK
jgi:hypothetical protein